MKSLRSTVYKLLFVLMLVLALSSAGTSAQQADDDSAHIFVSNLLGGSEPNIDVRLDGKPLVQGVQTIDAIAERMAAPGQYSLSITENDLSTDIPLFDPIQVTLEAGNLYAVVTGGTLPASTGGAWFTFVPLGQALAPGETVPGRVAVANYVEGLPAVDLALDGTIVASNVGSDEMVIHDLPISAFTQETWSNPQTGDVIMERDDSPPFPINEDTITVFILHGKYPGEPQDTYDSWLLPPIYVGEITIGEGSEIHVGDEVAVELKLGQRIRYPLALDETTRLDIRLLGASEIEDAFLRVYDADGNLLDENDEISYSDDAHDAGLTEVTLQPGDYLIEASSWGDVFPGSFTLSVK